MKSLICSKSLVESPLCALLTCWAGSLAQRSVFADSGNRVPEVLGRRPRVPQLPATGGGKGSVPPLGAPSRPSAGEGSEGGGKGRGWADRAGGELTGERVEGDRVAAERGREEAERDGLQGSGGRRARGPGGAAGGCDPSALAARTCRARGRPPKADPWEGVRGVGGEVVGGLRGGVAGGDGGGGAGADELFLTSEGTSSSVSRAGRRRLDACPAGPASRAAGGTAGGWGGVALAAPGSAEVGAETRKEGRRVEAPPARRGQFRCALAAHLSVGLRAERGHCVLSGQGGGQGGVALLVLRSEGQELAGWGSGATPPRVLNQPGPGAPGSEPEAFVSVGPALETCRRLEGLSLPGRRCA